MQIILCKERFVKRSSHRNRARRAIPAVRPVRARGSRALQSSTMTASADTHDVIRVRGARGNNLRSIDADIPKRRLTVVTGVSGSGKSSLVFDTVAAESRRLIDQTYSAFVQGFMPSLDRPDVDVLEGLTPAILVGQEPMGANARSTVGTATDSNALLRVLFSRFGSPHVGSPQAFAFNVASSSGAGAVTRTRNGRQVRERAEYSVTGGMCPRCEGLGRVSDIDLSQLYDDTLSLREGAITVPGYTLDGWYVRLYAESGFLDPDRPIKDYTKRQLEDFLYKPATKIAYGNAHYTYEGLVPRIRASMLGKDPDALQPHLRAFVERAVTFQVCPECGGTRLSEAARSSLVGGWSIADACSHSIVDLLAWARGLDLPGAAPLLASLRALLDGFVDIGLGYLSLDRPAGTLSGGEAQRTRMVSHVGSALTDVTYVFDEPTAGLHPHDVARMIALLEQLRDKGNTVLVVEHEPEVVERADHVIDLGPGAGPRGGRIVYEGSVEGLRASGTLTGRHLADRGRVKDSVRAPAGTLAIRGASLHNLRDIAVDLPLGVLCVLTGVAGSGKSSLVESLPDDADALVIDQGPIGGSRRSNPATYSGALDPIRGAFAKANGVKPALFSANSEGACPVCHGVGVTYTELGFMETVATTCEECAGRRYRDDVLGLTLAGRSIADVLDMSCAEAAGFFDEGGARTPKAHRILARLTDVGLGYLALGQPLTSLSGGERQRLKLAARMGEAGPRGATSLYVLDEPTTGLHPADVGDLLALLDRLVDGGTSVIVVEHDLSVMAHADWIVDLGPGAGSAGGRIVFEGTPAQMVADGSTLTAQYLAAHVRT